MVDAVIFDVDGTLVDSVDLHAAAWKEALAQFGYDVPFEQVRAQIGKGADQLIPVFVPKSELLRVEDELDYFRSELFKRKYLPKVQGMPGTRALFERLLADGKKLALASSAKGEELAHYRRVAGIADLVAEETSADDADRSKPFPDIFEAALARLPGASPNRCVVVGDSPYDAIAARTAHLRTVGLLCGGFPEEALWRAGCVALYKDPQDLLRAYESNPERVFEGGVASLQEAPTP